MLLDSRDGIKWRETNVSWFACHNPFAFNGIIVLRLSYQRSRRNESANRYGGWIYCLQSDSNSNTHISDTRIVCVWNVHVRMRSMALAFHLDFNLFDSCHLFSCFNLNTQNYSNIQMFFLTRILVSFSWLKSNETDLIKLPAGNKTWILWTQILSVD